MAADDVVTASPGSTINGGNGGSGGPAAGELLVTRTAAAASCRGVCDCCNGLQDSCKLCCPAIAHLGQQACGRCLCGRWQTALCGGLALQRAVGHLPTQTSIAGLPPSTQTSAAGLLTILAASDEMSKQVIKPATDVHVESVCCFVFNKYHHHSSLCIFAGTGSTSNGGSGELQNCAALFNKT